MSAPKLFIKPALSSNEVLEHEGKTVTEACFDRIIESDCDIYDEEDSRLVLRYRTSVISEKAVQTAQSIYGNIDQLFRPSLSRNSAAGEFNLQAFKKYRRNVVDAIPHPSNPFKAFPVTSNGKVLKSAYCNPVTSFMAGYNYDRYRKLGKPSGFSKEYPEKWEQSKPFFEGIGNAFSDIMNDKYSEMMHWAKENLVHPSFTVFNTPLTTVAINVNYESRLHFDRGDLEFGYSTLTKIDVGGEAKGGLFVMPKYRIAVDVAEQSLLLCQSHVDLHGNTSVINADQGVKRISFVTYTKWKLKHAKNHNIPCR